ncbi:MAG: alpha/beta fold hydrolase [Alphaproteobacteria bacterium]
MNTESVKHKTPSVLSLQDGKRLAYHLTEGLLPCVIFMGGFKSDMTGSKALALENLCKQRGQRFIRFDYTGHGQSSGNFRDGTIGSWQQDVLAVLDKLGSEKNILVGSSMGAWQMLLAAKARPEKIIALVGIASAPDFTEKLIWEQLSKEQKQTMSEQGEVLLPSCYGEDPYPITKQLIDDGRKHLLLDSPIPINVPVRLIHGLKDEDVPWQFSVRLAECLESNDVHVKYIKNGGHRLSDPEHLEIITDQMSILLRR